MASISASTPRRGHIWCAFWTTRGRSRFLLLRRTARLRQERYEVLGTYKYTSLAHLHGGSNVTQMNLEAQPWLDDFHAAAALDSVSFFWGFLLGLFLVFSAF